MNCKLQPEIAQAALKLHKDREYRVWVLARALDAAGSSGVKIADLQAFIRQEEIRGLSPRTLTKALKRGEGIFWTMDGERLWLRGMWPVSKALGITRLTHAPALIGCDWAQTLKTFRAACYAARFPAGDNYSAPISRKTLSKLTGRTARTQRNYDKAAGVEKKKNYKATGKSWRKGDTNIPDGHTVDYVQGKLELLRWMPNSYRAPLLPKAPRGMVYRVNKQMRGDLFRSGEEHSKRDKLYYTSDKSAARRRQSTTPDNLFYTVKTKVTWPDKPGKPIVSFLESRGGAVIWSEIQEVGGHKFFS